MAVLVMWSGISIAKDTLEPLIGQGADPDLYARIMKEVASYEGIVGTHDLIVHNYGPGRSMASIHAEVPRDIDIEVSHDIIDRIEHESVKNWEFCWSSTWIRWRSTMRRFLRQRRR